MNEGSISRIDLRLLEDEIGVAHLRSPILVLDQANEVQRTVADVSLSVGTDVADPDDAPMVFVEALERHRGELTLRTLPELLAVIRHRMHSHWSKARIEFPYFIERRAPVSGIAGLIDYDCRIEGISSDSGEDYKVGIRIPVTTLSPRSKTVSEGGARNQRAYVSVQLRSGRQEDGSPVIVWFEEIVDWVESVASSPLYALLKRPDERHVTMQAYDNPISPATLVRKVMDQVRTDGRVDWCRVRAEDVDSIHNHNSFAQITWRRESQW